MRHYLVYHSAERMGYSFREDDDLPDRVEDPEPWDDVDDFAIVTKKNADNLPGNVVWLISGEGHPRHYRLEHWFVVDGTEAKTSAHRSDSTRGWRQRHSAGHAS